MHTCLSAISAQKGMCCMQVVQQLVKQLDTKKKELADFQEKYKIRIRVCLLQMWRLLGTHACFHY